MGIKTSAGIATAVAAALLLAGCGDDGSGSTSGSGSGGGGNTLTFWVMQGTNPDASAFYKAAKAEFKKKTGATLKIQEVSWADAHDKLVRSFAAGNGPDVSEIGTTWTPEFAADGGLADLTSKIKSSGAGKDIIPALKDSATYDGKQYGVGWYAGVRAMIYRKDIFAKAGVSVPKNWSQLESVIKTLKQKEPNMAPMPIAGGASYDAMPFIWGAGGEMANKQGGKWVSGIDRAKAKQGLKFYTDLALKDKSSTTAASTWLETDLLDSFTKGKSVMVIQGNWTPKTVVQNNPKLKGKIGVFPVPGKNGGMAPAFLGGSNLSVMAKSTHKDLAWKFIQMMTTGDLGTKWADQTGYFPGTTTLLKSYATSSDPLVAPFAKVMLKAGKNVPNAPQWGTVQGNKTITQMLQSILTGTSIDQATSKAASSIDSTLNQSS